MSKVNCAAVRKRRQASLRMARAELLHILNNSSAITGKSVRMARAELLREEENNHDKKMVA